jgi:pilus assembly protein CpaB
MARRPNLFSVELTDPERVAGFASPGSLAAISKSGDPVLYLPSGEKRELPLVTRIPIPKVQVLGVGATTITSRTTKDDDGTETTEQVPLTIPPIAVGRDRAEKVIYPARDGDPSVALRTDKTRDVDRPGTTARDITREIFRGES